VSAIGYTDAGAGYAMCPCGKSGRDPRQGWRSWVLGASGAEELKQVKRKGGRPLRLPALGVYWWNATRRAVVAWATAERTAGVSLIAFNNTKS
jgi:hypothetical protein